MKMKKRYDHYDRFTSPHYMKNYCILGWLIAMLIPLLYVVYDMHKKDKSYNVQVSKPIFGKCFVKGTSTKIVSVFDSSGHICCVFADSTDIINRK